MMSIAEILNLNYTLYKYNVQKQQEKDKKCKHVPKVTNHVCREFEMEVLNECTKHIIMKTKVTTDGIMDRKKANNTNQFLHRLIRECARDIHNREYWNEKSGSFIKKWQIEKLTCNLMFSNKWVSGLLRREHARRVGSTVNNNYNNDNNDNDDNSIDMHIQSSDQVENMNIISSDEVYHAADNDNIKDSLYDDGNVKVFHDDGDGGNDLLRDIIAFINGKGSL